MALRDADQVIGERSFGPRAAGEKAEHALIAAVHAGAPAGAVQAGRLDQLDRRDADSSKAMTRAPPYPLPRSR